MEEFCKGLLFCPLCMAYSVAEPVELLCAGHHIFCFSCLYNYQEHNEALPCPICRTGDGVISLSRTVKSVATMLKECLPDEEKRALVDESMSNMNENGNLLEEYLRLLPKMKTQMPGIFKNSESTNIISTTQLNYFRRFKYFGSTLKIDSPNLQLRDEHNNVAALLGVLKIPIAQMKYIVAIIKHKQTRRRTNRVCSYESIVLPACNMADALKITESWKAPEGELQPVIFIITIPAVDLLLSKKGEAENNGRPSRSDFSVIYQKSPVPIFFHTTLMAYLSETFLMSEDFVGDFFNCLRLLYKQMNYTRS